MAMNFDPMTGKPINNGVPRFDPMTGEPINNGAPRFDPMTGKPMHGYHKKDNKGMKAKWIIAAVVVIALIVGIAVCAVASGMFLNAPNKVLYATYNTFTDGNKLVEELADTKVFEKDEVTAEVSICTDVMDIDMTAVNSKKEKQISARLNMQDLPEIDVVASLDKEYLKLQIPSISDQVIGYNYVDEKAGFLAENLTSEELDMVDEALAMVFEATERKENEEFVESLMDAMKDAYKTLEFEKTDKEKYEVDGKDVSCKGYETTISDEFFIELINASSDAVYDYYGEELDTLLAAEGITWNELVDEMLYEVEDMSEINATFYVYKNKLASIVMTNEYDSTIEILFLGGDTRMQNMEVVVDGETAMEVKGETSGSEEKVVISSYDAVIMELGYNSKTGAYYVNASDGLYMTGVLEVSKKEFRLDINELIVEDVYLRNNSICIRQGADLTSLNGEMLDIGNATESELQNLVMEYSELFGYMY